MTGNRFTGLFTGFMVTAIIQSSTACTLITISFVNAGLLTLTQSIAVIFGANIGTTLTGWIVSLIGFKVSISNFALPAIGIGFIITVIKWKYKSSGDFLLGLGFLFLGLHFLTIGMASINQVFNFDAIGTFRDLGYRAILISAGAGLVMTVLINSSTASQAIIMTMAFNNVITYEMAAGMILGANLGTTFSAPLASLAGNVSAKRAAAVHVMFNIIGIAWALPMILPLLKVVSIILPGDPWAIIPGNAAIPLHLAGLHTVFNIINTGIFLPFVNQYSRFICFLIRDKKDGEKSGNGHYRFEYLSSRIVDSPELNIMRVGKEIRDMAGVALSMYARFNTLLQSLRGIENKEDAVTDLCEELKKKEEYADEMRESLTRFLMECTREHLNARSEQLVSRLIRVIAYVEEMTDDCYIVGLSLEKSVRKNRVISDKEMEDLVPYLNKVEEFLGLLQEQLAQNPAKGLGIRTRELEKDINKSRKKLQKLSRKRIEAGKDVKTELFFFDLVRRIEKLGDYCYDISSVLKK